ncbi:MAG: hypothetical protein COS07_00125, partial [Candidatus Aenigmarchaeota archaeon CG01_land_8_20_14_3_00_37_9]
ETQIMGSDIVKKYIIFGLLAIFLVLGVFYIKASQSKTGKASAVDGNDYTLGIGESVIINGNNIQLQDVDSQGNVKLYINSIRYTVKDYGEFAGFAISIVDYNYDDSKVGRKVTFHISPYKPDGALMIGGSTVTKGKTIIIDDVSSSGIIKIQVGGKAYEISESGVYDGVDIILDDFYYTYNQEERWVKLSFREDIITTTTTEKVEIQKTTTTSFKPPEQDYNFFQIILNWVSGLFSR